jgi:hypothetical protein
MQLLQEQGAVKVMRDKSTEVADIKEKLHRYSVYLLYWYKSTNTDSEGALQLAEGLT